MKPVQNIRLLDPDRTAWIYVFPVVYAILLFTALSGYLQWQSVNFILGIAVLPRVLQLKTTQAGSQRLGAAAFAFGTMAFLLPVTTLLYGAVLLTFLYWIESFFGKTGFLLWAVLVLLSPVFQYFANVFSFPLRLQLTAVAGALLQTAGVENTVEGNVIRKGAVDFSVDPACMGLNMLVTALLATIIIIADRQRKVNREAGIMYSLLLLLLAFVLTTVANLFRIILMVQFSIFPDTLLHDITGIICFAVYVVVPVFFIVKFTLKEKLIKPRSPVLPAKKTESLNSILFIHSVLTVLLLVAAFRPVSENPPVAITNSVPESYSAVILQDGIRKLENKKSLVYIKPVKAFYSSDHSPQICWQGSGYAFAQIGRQEIGGQDMYTGVLEKGRDRLYAAWWYDNGTDRTISQLDWRWKMLTGARPFSIINVNCTDLHTLNEVVKEILQAKLFNPLIQ